jgi:hypothetical protein
MSEEEIVITEGEYHVELKAEKAYSGPTTISVKWDGCANIWIDKGKEDQDYIHICDVPEFIRLLQRAYDEARGLQTWFGD